MDGVETSDHGTDITMEIVEAVANAKGTDPRTLEPKLHDVVDPEALERLIETGSMARVTFSYGEYTVVVEQDGSVEVTRPAVTVEPAREALAVDGRLEGSG